MGHSRTSRTLPAVPRAAAAARLRPAVAYSLLTGDWKIDENPVDGEEFDREMFDSLGALRC